MVPVVLIPWHLPEPPEPERVSAWLVIPNELLGDLAVAWLAGVPLDALMWAAERRDMRVVSYG
jgi:hypothetical protein